LRCHFEPQELSRMAILAVNVSFRHLLPRPSRHLGHPNGVAAGSHLRHTQQASTNHVQIRQPGRHEQSMRVPLQSSIARLRKVEKALDDQERVFDIGANARICIVPCSRRLTDCSLATRNRALQPVCGCWVRDVEPLAAIVPCQLVGTNTTLNHRNAKHED